MSIGIFEHRHFGLVRRQILNNKYVLEAEYNYNHYRNWASRFEKFQSTYLKSKEIQHLIFPEEIFFETDREFKEDSQDIRVSSKEGETLTIIYEHYPLTLGEELRHRIETNSPFSSSQLWYLLYALVHAALELTQVHSLFNPDLPLVMHPDTVLLNQLGFLKALCFHSSPKYTVRDHKFETPTQEDFPIDKKNLLQATYSVGRIMASLLLFRQLNSFGKEGLFDKLTFDSEFERIREKSGIMGNIVMGMLQGVPEQRILLHEIAALLSPYEECLLGLSGFRLDRNVCYESMIDILMKQG